MASQPTSPLAVGQVLEITFATFTPRITIRSERQLTVEIIAGDNIGFSDTVEYEAVAVRDGLVILSWQEHIGKYDRARARFHFWKGIHRGDAGERQIYAADRSD